MVLAKPGRSLSAINPPVMCSLHIRDRQTDILEKNGLLSNFGCATLLSPGWWIPAKIWCGAPSKFSVPHMVLAKLGCSLSATNPPVMRSLHKSASHHWADIKQVFSGECGEWDQFHHTTQRSHPISNPLIQKNCTFASMGHVVNPTQTKVLILSTKI